MATTTTTKDLDRLLEELKRTSLNSSSSNASQSSVPHFNSTRSSRIYSNHQRSSFTESSGVGNVGRQSTRSYSFVGSGGNRHGERWTNSSSSNFTNYPRSQKYTNERGTGGLRNATTGDSGTAVFVRHATPAPEISSGQQKRYQTIFRATLQHESPASPKRFNQVNVTIDPEFGATASSLASDNRGYLTPSLSRTHQTAVTTAVNGNKGPMSNRELQLLEDLSSARQELAALRRASSPIDEPQPPSTLPTQRRVFHHHLENTETLTNRHQSHHDVHQESSFRRPHGRYDTMSSGYTFGMPERAMSSANVATGHAWNYRNGMTSGPHSPALGYSSIRSMGSSLRSGGLLSNSQGYSARRERLRQEAEHAEARRQNFQPHANHLTPAASSNDERVTSLHQQCRQHYHSMSAIQPGRREFEEIETVTLQPIGRGVQDLMGSTAASNRSTKRPVASSMLEGLNRVDNSTGTRQQRSKMQSFGLQSSAVDILHTTSIRPQRTASNSYLSSLRRQSAEVASEMGSLQQQRSTNSPMHQSRQAQHQYHYQQQISQQTSKPLPIMQQGHQSQQHSELFKNPNQQQSPRNNVEWTSQQIASNDNGPADLAFVKATSTVWYRLNISRQEAISILKNQPPGSFLIRDSTTFKGAYGLAVKSPKPPNKTGQKSDDFNGDLVRHYLIETVVMPSQGVRIKGFSAEQVFPDLLALVQYHTQYPVALPCCLVLPSIPPSQAGGIINSTLVRNGGDSENGDSDSVTLVQNTGAHSFNPTLVSLNGHTVATELLTASPPTRSITSPLSPTAGMFHSELTSPPPTISCRCLFLGAVEADSSRGQASLMQAVDVLIPGPTLRAVTCDQMGADCPVQYTECQIQVTHNEGLLITDISHKLFFQRHYPASSIIWAGIDPRDKAFIHPNHTVLGLDKAKLFGFITKKPNGEYLTQVFSEFDANCGAAIFTAQTNSLLLPHK